MRNYTALIRDSITDGVLAAAGIQADNATAALLKADVQAFTFDGYVSALFDEKNREISLDRDYSGRLES